MSRLAGLVAKLLLAVALAAFLLALVLTSAAALLVTVPYRRMSRRGARLAAGQQLLLALLAFAAIARQGRDGR